MNESLVERLTQAVDRGIPYLPGTAYVGTYVKSIDMPLVVSVLTAVFLCLQIYDKVQELREKRAAKRKETQVCVKD